MISKVVTQLSFKGKFRYFHCASANLMAKILATDGVDEVGL